MKANVIAGLIVVLGAVQARAWGPAGHEIIGTVGALSQPSAFFAANSDSMRQLSTVPDRVWKAPKTKSNEAPTHWFQADAYIRDLSQASQILQFPRSYAAACSQYTEPVVVKNGTATFRIIQFYNLAVSYFKAGDVKSGLQMAGVMTHYVGDLSMPLHVSANYDGQQTGNNGIHAHFETQVITSENESMTEVSKRTKALLADPAYLAEFKGDLADLLDREVIRSLLKRDEVLANDSKYGRTAQGDAIQLNLAEDRMADGAATLAIILSRLAKDAALGSNSTTLKVGDPKWVAPAY